MKGLNPEMMKKLQQGAFVRHIPGVYDYDIRLGHGPAGTTGVVKWALSFALTGEVSQL